MSTSCWRSRACVVRGAVLDATGVTTLVDRGFRGMAKTSARRPNATTTASRPGCAPGGAGDRASGQRVDAAGWRGLLYRVRDVYRAAAALICLGRWIHRIPT